MTYDFVIVGAGSAGCVLARRLADDAGFSVLLLEAGGTDRHPYIAVPAGTLFAVGNRRFDWSYEVEPDASRNGRTDRWPAGRALGGGSAINGMMFVRGHQQDYDQWDEQGCRGWDYKSLLPYFKRLESSSRGGDQWRGDSGPQQVSDTRAPSPLTDLWIEALVNAGVPRSHDLNGVAPDGVDYVQASQKKGWRHTTGSAFVRPVLKRAPLTLELHATVERVNFSGNRATGVSYQRGGLTKEVSARNGVIISAGTMGSPTLLMRSGIGDGEALTSAGISVVSDVPGVGRNLQDHPGVTMSFNIDHPTFGSEAGPLSSLIHGLNFLTRGRGPLTTSVGHAQAFVRTSKEMALPNAQLVTSPFAYDFTETGAKLVRDRVLSMGIGLMRPRSRGQIRLQPEDPAGRPVIDYEMLADEQDVTELADAVKFARKAMATSPMREILIDERYPGVSLATDEALIGFVRDTCFSMYHQVGTCKMGTDDLSVVDPNLAVGNVQGLWVADASVMPTLPSGNTNATCIMIGERAANLIADAHGKDIPV